MKVKHIIILIVLFWLVMSISFSYLLVELFKKECDSNIFKCAGKWSKKIEKDFKEGLNEQQTD